MSSAPSSAPGLVGRRDECDRLDRLLAEVRAGHSGALVLRGEAGVGKSALLDHLVQRAPGCRVARAAGVESEMELAFAGLHQLCGSMRDRLDGLPGPQRDALATAFGLSDGRPPDRFLVGLAVLSLLSAVADEQPLLCVIDDAQWLDRVSSQTLAFVARRLVAESVALVFAVREPAVEHDLAGLPELVVGGLGDDAARTLLDSALTGPVDAQVRDRIVTETRGNPLALLELPRGLTPAQLAGGFGLSDAMPLAGRIEQGFVSRLAPLADDTRRLLLAAAAEPIGDVTLLRRAVDRLGIGAEAAVDAEATGLIEFGASVRFRHPLVRSAAYRSASAGERHDVHRALAEASDPELDPDRRAWHRAHATPGPDDDVAAELERSAGRAQARGGLAAAAAFLGHAATLTSEPAHRAQRGLAAAQAKHDAGALDAALVLLTEVETGPPDALRTAEVEYLRGQIALDQRLSAAAAPLLCDAARRLEPLDAELARETHLVALGAALWTGRPDELLAAAQAARAAPPPPFGVRPVDAVLDALALRLTDGYAAAAPLLVRALAGVRAPDVEWRPGDRAGDIVLRRWAELIALEAWEFEPLRALGVLQVKLARDTGALVHLQFALNFLAHTLLLAGELTAAAALIEEDRLIAEATGDRPVALTAVALAAWRGDEGATAALIEATLQEARVSGQGRMATFAAYAGAVLDNGRGRHGDARDALWPVFARDIVGFGPFVVPELAEAAFHCGDSAQLAATQDWLTERTGVTPTDWSAGIESRIRAFRSAGDAADGLYRESIDRLAGVRAQCARGQLLYGEWLRREGRREAARQQLRIAHEQFATMGLGAFAERARRELRATGETARLHTAEAGADELTAQEAQIARLAGDGLSNPEIGTRLFISPRTVEWHLRKVFGKLGISSRKELGRPDGRL